jgi:hypothetical protein
MHSTLVLHPNYEHLRSRLTEILDDFHNTGEYVTKGERNVIKKVEEGTVVFNIKKFKTPSFFQGLVYQYLRKSKAKRSFEYASQLIDFGINTPFPVGYSETFSGGLKDSYYISLHMDYDLDFRVLIHNPKYPNRNLILKQFTAFCYKLHENGVNFLDHSPGNTLIIKRSDTSYDFYLIDLNRMKFETLDLDRRMHNLRRLWLSKTMVKILAASYSELSGNTYVEVHGLLTKYSRAFQKKVNSKKLRKRRRYFFK